MTCCRTTPYTPEVDAGGLKLRDGLIQVPYTSFGAAGAELAVPTDADVAATFAIMIPQGTHIKTFVFSYNGNATSQKVVFYLEDSTGEKMHLFKSGQGTLGDQISGTDLKNGKVTTEDTMNGKGEIFPPIDKTWTLKVETKDSGWDGTIKAVIDVIVM